MARDDIGTCDSCSSYFSYQLIHNGFNDTAFAYFDRCGCTAFLNGYCKAVPSAAKLTIGGPVNIEAEALLAPSAHPDAQCRAARDISTLVAGNDTGLSPRFVVVSNHRSRSTGIAGHLQRNTQYWGPRLTVSNPLAIDVEGLRIYPVLSKGASAYGPQVPLSADAAATGSVESHAHTVTRCPLLTYPA